MTATAEADTMTVPRIRSGGEEVSAELLADELPIAVERLAPRTPFTASPQPLPPFPSLIYRNKIEGCSVSDAPFYVNADEPLRKPRRRGWLGPSLFMLSIALWSGLAGYVAVKQEPLRLTVIEKRYADRLPQADATPEGHAP